MNFWEVFWIVLLADLAIFVVIVVIGLLWSIACAVLDGWD